MAIKRITISDGPRVDQDRVSLPAGDEIEFVPARPDLKFDVTFDQARSPFNDHHFHNREANKHRTGGAKPGHKGEHKYDVKIGDQLLDPIIIVEGP